MAALKHGRLEARNSPLIQSGAVLPKAHRKRLKRFPKTEELRRETIDIADASGTVSDAATLAMAGTKALLRR
ncbi:hypothetical protein ABWH89_21145 [Hoeflea alexandrii]|uniref:hypothetical protein n=1 Tax=Hoeflea alexandrii TaxID=288436 RepID=UPI0035CF879B